MVKLNIEMSMATLITKLAREAGLGDEETNDHDVSLSYAKNRSQVGRSGIHHSHNDAVLMNTYHTTTVEGRGSEEDFEGMKDINGIHRRVDVRIESTSNSDTASNHDRVEDEMSLTNHPGHPRGT